MLKKFTSKESILKKYYLKTKKYLFKILTPRALPIFLKGGDIISSDPLIFGYHELRVAELINFYALNGYGDYLIDIGANIGLTSCQSGNLFQEVHCYEPNPDCFSILHVNTKITLTKPRVTLNNFGLGEKKMVTYLHVPKGNWGGGFIHDQNNSYSDQEIGSKDGYRDFNPKNYDVISIEIESGPDKLTEVFKTLNGKNLKNGFIKIDVEGYEPLIIEAIASSIPKDMGAVILFECLAKQFDPNDLLMLFKGRAQAYKLIRSPEKHESKVKRLIQIIGNFGYTYKLVDFNQRSNSVDVVFVVSRLN